MNTKQPIFLIFIICYLLLTNYCFAEEHMTITSETLEYSEETFTYIATGNVRIQKDDVIIEADKVRYNEQTSDLVAEGSVRYNDTDSIINASSLEMNLDTKTGKIYNAEIFYVQTNYHISGKEIEKRGERYYFSPDAKFTTCDAPVPEWCFRGKNVNAVIGKDLTASDVTFCIKDIPVLYTPYLYAPILTERQTGFLMPSLGYSESRGGYFSIPFFWAISENIDATIVMDLYTKRGIGENLEYRYLYPLDISGKWWLYHIRDTELNKDFWEFSVLHEQRNTERVDGFLNVNYVNEKDFFNEFSTDFKTRSTRFLESTGEVSLQFTNSRFYLMSEYWIDLEKDSDSPPQTLPEAGFVLNPTKLSYLWVSASTTFSNFWREDGIYGQRYDIHPQISHKIGDDIVFLQTAGLRETAYSLNESEDNSLHREVFEYKASVQTDLFKRYGSFTHILQPSITYTFITGSEDIPVFDSTEVVEDASLTEISLLNRFIDRKGELIIIKASQGFDSYSEDKHFLPTSLEISVKRPVFLRLDTSYDTYTNRFEDLNSDLWLKVSDTTFSVGQRYSREDNITFYNAGIGFHPYKPLYMDGKIWYDAEEKEIEEISVLIKYESQCWGINMDIIKRPDDFIVTVMFELKGLTKGIRI
ncbi:MAG: LPS assembly protein LptD [Nitrospirota bacterium]